MVEKEHICPACGGTMDKMGPPNVGWLRCSNDHWIEKIEKYDSWVEWYRAYHDNPNCGHEKLKFQFLPHAVTYLNTVDEDQGDVRFMCACEKCFHHVRVTISRADLSQFLTSAGGRDS